MLLPTMTYDEIYQAICKDMPLAWEVAIKKSKEYHRTTKRATRYPIHISTEWVHPISKTTYRINYKYNKRSEWDQPQIGVSCKLYHGRELNYFAIAVTNGGYSVSVFSPHYLQRYQERFLNGQCDVETAFSTHLNRNTSMIPMGEDYSSPNEIEGEDSEFVNQAIAIIDGVCLGKLHKKVRLFLYKTYVSANEIKGNQIVALYQHWIHLYYMRALIDCPRFAKRIKEIYFNGIAECNKYADPNLPLPQDEALKQLEDAYNNTLQDLKVYIYF